VRAARIPSAPRAEAARRRATRASEAALPPLPPNSCPGPISGARKTLESPVFPFIIWGLRGSDRPAFFGRECARQKGTATTQAVPFRPMAGIQPAPARGQGQGCRWQAATLWRGERGWRGRGAVLRTRTKRWRNRRILRIAEDEHCIRKCCACADRGDECVKPSPVKSKLPGVSKRPSNEKKCVLSLLVVDDLKYRPRGGCPCSTPPSRAPGRMHPLYQRDRGWGSQIQR